MSEYQYFEFQAIDEPLTDEVQQELRRISSRAQVTPSGFINVYNYGDIRADPLDLLQRYFDAFCYVSNWGSRELIFRIPVDLINEEQAEIYCVDDIAGFRRKGDFLIIGFESQSEEYEWAEGEGWLSSMISLREDIIRGDFRCLYLAWLLGVQLDLVDPGEQEPVVPPGLDNLNGALSTFIRFMRIDQDLVTVAARGSKSISASEEHQQVKTWICTLENDEKNDIIFRLIIGNEVHLGKKLYHRFLKTVQGCADKPEYYGLRSGGELLEQAEIYEEERKKLEAEERARQQALLKKQQALERKKYLAGLAGREEELWRQIQSLVAGKRPTDYDQAVQLLLDLRDLAQGRSEKAAFQQKLALLAEEHRRKYSFIKKLNTSGFSV